MSHLCSRLLMTRNFHRSKLVLSKAHKTQAIWLLICPLIWFPTFLHFHHALHDNLIPCFLWTLQTHHPALEPCTNYSLWSRPPPTHTPPHTYSVLFSSLNLKLSFWMKLLGTALFHGATASRFLPLEKEDTLFFFYRVSSSNTPDSLLTSSVYFFLSSSITAPSNLSSFFF